VGSTAQHVRIADHPDWLDTAGHGGHIYTFGTYTIKAHGYVKIHTGRGINTQTDRYWDRRWYVSNNTGIRRHSRTAAAP
jgi:hypothetical protein